MAAPDIRAPHRAGGLPSLGRRGEGWIGMQVALELAIIIGAPFTGARWPDPWHAIALIGGLALIAGGVLGFAWGAAHLGRSFSIWVPPLPAARFVATGPYRYVRHPICTSQVLLCAGFALAAGSLLGLLLVPVVAIYLDRGKLAREEATLLDAYPAEYAAFIARVPHRMLPIPRSR